MSIEQQLEKKINEIEAMFDGAFTRDQIKKELDACKNDKD